MNRSIPHSVGVIMDGNRRWAKEKGLPTFEGHRAGYEKLREFLGWCKDIGVNDVVVFAFSTENWNRKQEEVSYLLDLFRTVIADQLTFAQKEKIQLLFPGDISQFPEDIQHLISSAIAKTKDFTQSRFAVALSYGGRAEIVNAIKRIPKDKIDSLTEQEFSKYIWTSGIADPDMIIRTSGEKRLSGFLAWKSVYSELFFTDTYWPAFSKEEFLQMVDEFAERERRYGK